jgi:protein SCO1/2
MLILLSLFHFSIRAENNESELEIGVIEHLDDTLPENIRLFHEDLGSISLDEIIDKPTVISLVYYRCPGICSPLMDGIADVIDKSDLNLGEDYQVLTISFDPREGLDLAKNKKKNYLNLMDKKEQASKHWNFFTSDSLNIAKLTNAVGFKYKPQGNDFLHSASLIFVSPEGKITRYLNGTNFLPFEFKMAILETSKGQSGPTINKVLQYCYSYDPQGQQYVLNITRVFGAFIMIIAVILFLILVLKPLIKKRQISVSHE